MITPKFRKGLVSRCFKGAPTFLPNRESMLAGVGKLQTLITNPRNGGLNQITAVVAAWISRNSFVAHVTV